MTTLKALALVAALALPGAAQAWEEPARGTELRGDLMDALRPMAEWDLGAPVEFVVLDLRVAGDVAFASVMAQRPGGAPIVIQDTPFFQRGEIDPEIADGATIQALLQRSGRMWVPVQFAIGATDVWYFYEGFCPIWGGVLTEFCGDKN
ncbi:MAG: hypothetical protein KDJ98_09365 [Rhodobacteraceae bacterium]|nr:hypothetical protein [Paracoccaceae bacterium]